MAKHLRIKICGITRPEDARDAAGLGADAIGLTFYPQSPRCVSAGQATAILEELPLFVEPVAVFVNEPVGSMIELARRLGRVSTFQWHGEAPPAVPAPFCLVAAFAVRGAECLAGIVRYLEHCRANAGLPAAILVDAYAPDQHGGTGRTAPWDLLADFRPTVPVILAGGLTPENVAEAVRRVRPFAIDVASGVESRPGWKDLDKMRRLIENARAAYE